MRKRTLVAALAVGLVCGYATSAGAMQMSTSEAILLIDGVGDANDTVDVSIVDTGTGYDFGYWDGSDFVVILDDADSFTTETFIGGTVIDFAIMDTNTLEVYKLSDGDATLEFTGMVDAQYSQNPAVPYDYYQSVTITWTIGSNTLSVNLSDTYDGFAPAASAPEPSAALIFGLGFVLFERIVRRNMRR